MYYIVLSTHLILCLVLIGLVLLQQGKGADMGAAFGGGSNTLFGASGAATFLTKLTTMIAIAFMATSILLVRLSTMVNTSAGSYDPLRGSVVEHTATTNSTTENPAQGAAPAPVAPPSNDAAKAPAAPGEASSVK